MRTSILHRKGELMHHGWEATDTWLPLTLAAQRLGLSWHATWARLLRGDLEGRKQEGRWMVTVASVERVRQARAAQALEA